MGVTQRTEPGGGDAWSRLFEAARVRTGVIISYRSADAELAHDFLLFPKRFFGRSGHRYVEGWSAHRPSRIKFGRYAFSWFGGSGMVRAFRLDRIRDVGEREPQAWSIGSYLHRKIVHRGIAGALWGFFLDLCVIAMIVALIVASGCGWMRGPKPITIDELRAHNREAITHLSLGMSREQLMLAMGTMRAVNEVWTGPTVVDWTELSANNPQRTEVFSGAKGEQVEIVYYVTETKRDDGAITDDELTPVILVNGIVQAWGWTALREIPTIEIRRR